MISVVIISKDEPALDETLVAVGAQARALDQPAELVVVDASEGRMDAIGDRHPDVRWLAFAQPPGVRISIPHQRNAGVRAASGDIIAFTDCGCVPRAGWLAALVAPIVSGEEDVTAGLAQSTGERRGLYDSGAQRAAEGAYLSECPTINLAFRKSAYDAVGGFDESFEYGSDIDFSWRLTDRGFQIRSASDAVVEHDWGDSRRQLKRSYQYGRARARLYAKHRRRLRTVWRRDPMVVAYPVYLLGLPIVALYPAYLALLAVPAWRNRHDGSLRVVADHLAYGVGVLSRVVSR